MHEAGKDFYLLPAAIWLRYLEPRQDLIFELFGHWFADAFHFFHKLIYGCI